MTNHHISVHKTDGVLHFIAHYTERDS